MTDICVKPEDLHTEIKRETFDGEKTRLPIVIVIVIEYLYSATQEQRRSRPGPVSSLVKREVFRRLRNWSKEMEKRSARRD